MDANRDESRPTDSAGEEPASRTQIAHASRISERANRARQAPPACLITYASEEPGRIGRRHALGEEDFTIGRAPASTLVIESETVSRHHAKSIRRGRLYVLIDCGAANGTYLGDELVDEQTLRSGNLLQVGPEIPNALAGPPFLGYEAHVGSTTTRDSAQTA